SYTMLCTSLCDKGGMLMRFISPSTRIIGGTPEDRCRSDALFLTANARSCAMSTAIQGSLRATKDSRRAHLDGELGARLTNARLLRTTRSGIFRRSFPLHSIYYARETIAESCSLGVILATAIIGQTGSSDDAPLQCSAV